MKLTRRTVFASLAALAGVASAGFAPQPSTTTSDPAKLADAAKSRAAPVRPDDDRRLHDRNNRVYLQPIGASLGMPAPQA